MYTPAGLFSQNLEDVKTRLYRSKLKCEKRFAEGLEKLFNKNNNVVVRLALTLIGKNSTCSQFSSRSIIMIGIFLSRSGFPHFASC